jgi:peptide/nickel transport system substrate-binding protein
MFTRPFSLLFLLLIVFAVACSPAPQATAVPTTALPVEATEVVEADLQTEQSSTSEAIAEPGQGVTATPDESETSVPQSPALPSLVIAIGGESEDGYDPTQGWGRYGSPLFQSTLLRRLPDMSIAFDLATSYEVSEDGLVWTITLRDDAMFADGTPVTANDVAFTFETAAQSGSVVDLTGLEAATALDEYTVEFRLAQPQSTFINRLLTLGIVPKDTYDATTYNRAPLGSGPFRMVHWEEGQYLTVEPNPYYYDALPPFAQITFLFLGEDTAFAAAQKGDLHLVTVPASLGNQEIEGMTLRRLPSVDNRGMMFPMVRDNGETTEAGHPIGNNVTSDLAVRQAINYAIDRQALVEGILEGFGAPAAGSVDGLPWWNEDTAVGEPDTEKAIALLEEAGWDYEGGSIRVRNGQKAEFFLLYPASDNVRQSLALAVSDMVTPLGIHIEPRGASWEEIETLMHSNAVMFGWGSHDQLELYNLYHSSQAGQGWYNTGFYSNPTADKYLDLAMSATSEREANAYWQKAQWDGTTGLSWRGDAPWAWLVNLDHLYFTDECLELGEQGVQPHGHGWPITAHITQWQWVCD